MTQAYDNGVPGGETMRHTRHRSLTAVPSYFVVSGSAQLTSLVLKLWQHDRASLVLSDR